MSSKRYLVNIGKITSFEDTILQLITLKNLLDISGFRQFQLFNAAYLVVTNEIKNAAANHHFDNPDFIERFTVCFSKYYFKAINDSAVNSTIVAPSWKLLNEQAKKKGTPKFIFLMMSANAHINNDLPLALVELMSKEESEDLLKDVLKLDKILMKSGREIIGLFSEPNMFLNFLKKRFIFLYYRPAMYTILYWRIKAWHDYHEIKEHGLEKSNYQKRSIFTALHIIRLAWILGADRV